MKPERMPKRIKVAITTQISTELSYDIHRLFSLNAPSSQHIRADLAYKIIKTRKRKL